VILFPPVSGQPPSGIVTQWGGTVTINGLSYSASHLNIEPLTPGTEYLFLLKKRGSTYERVATYYGVFRIENHTLMPLKHEGGVAEDFSGLSANDAIARLVSVRKTLP
jgi:hypothetical protein